MSNEDHRKRVAIIGVPDCDQVCCPKLDGVLKVLFPKDAIKADGYLSCLQQFWLDAVTPLATVLESAEEGDLVPVKVVSATQKALYLMGTEHQQMAQERRKKLILKLNPLLKFMSDDSKSFTLSAPMLFGDEFAKQATTTVQQIKAMKKLNIPSEKKGHFFWLPPSKLPKRLQGWSQEWLYKIPALSEGEPGRTIKNKGLRISRKLCKLSQRNYNLSPYFEFKCSILASIKRGIVTSLHAG